MKQKKYNIAVFSNQSYPITSGAADVVHAHCMELTALGHNVVLFCEPLPTGMEDIQVPYSRIRFYAYEGIDIDIKYPKDTILNTVNSSVLCVFNNIKFDVVYTHAFNAQSYVGKVLAHKYGIPHIAHMHTNFLWDITDTTEKIVIQKLLRDFYRDANAVVYTNTQSMSVFSSLYLLDNSKSYVIQNSSLLPEITENSEEFIPYRKVWNCENDIVLAYSGRVEYDQKNIETNLLIVRRLIDLGLPIKFWIIGTGSGILQCMDTVIRLNLQPYVIFTGNFSDKFRLANVVQQCDALLLCSYYDTDAICIRDFARQHKTSIVMEDSLCCQDKKNLGIITIPNDVDIACECIYNKIKNSELQSLGEDCYNKLNNNWSDIVSGQLISLIQRCCDAGLQ